MALVSRVGKTSPALEQTDDLKAVSEKKEIYPVEGQQASDIKYILRVPVMFSSKFRLSVK